MHRWPFQRWQDFLKIEVDLLPCTSGRMAYAPLFLRSASRMQVSTDTRVHHAFCWSDHHHTHLTITFDLRIYAGMLPSFAECKQLVNFYCYENQFAGACSRVSTDRREEVSCRSVVPVLQTVVLFFLKTDLIRAFYAGALPSFAECKQLDFFRCDSNKFTGAYFARFN